MKWFWNWILSLLGRKPKKILTQTIDVDNVFLSSFQTEKKRLDKIRTEAQEIENKKKQEALEMKERGIDPKYIKAAFDFAGRQIAREKQELDIIISLTDLKISYEEFQIFSDQFIEICAEKDIKAHHFGGGSVKIIFESLRKYKRRCEENTQPKPKTITSGAYR
jgi:hypothetical protein